MANCHSVLEDTCVPEVSKEIGKMFRKSEIAAVIYFQKRQRK